MFMRHFHIPPCIPDSHPHRITSTKCRINTVVSPDDGHIVAPKHVEIDKYTKNKYTINRFCKELALNTRMELYLPLSPSLYLHILLSETHPNKSMCDIFGTLYYSVMYFFYSEA